MYRFDFLLLIIAVSLGLPTIYGVINVQESGPLTVESNDTEPVTLKCVADPHNTITWKFLDHDIRVATGKNGTIELLADSRIYSVNGSLDTLPADKKVAVYTLTIVNGKLTYGVYECYTDDGSKLHQVVTLSGLTVDNILTPGNQTDCCMQQKVSKECLKVCNPAEYDLTGFSLSICASDVNKIHNCNKAYKNNVRCCFRRGLPTGCLDFCMDRPITPPLLKACGAYREHISLCNGEGLVRVPGPPQHVTGFATSPTSFTVAWSPPTSEPALLQAYYLFYSKSNDSNYKSIKLDPGKHSFAYTNALPNTVYFVYLQSIGEHGSSYPSVKTSIATTEAQFNKFVHKDSVAECCVAAKIPQNCTDQLCLGKWSRFAVTPCYGYLLQVVKCYADGVDHTRCCKESDSGVKPECVGFCSGKTLPVLPQNLTCFSDMSGMSRCFDASAMTVPKAPRNVIAAFVGDDEIQLTWTQPTFLGSGTPHYIVKFIRSGYLPQTVTTREMGLTLSSLIPATHYRISVVAANKFGTSLPSNMLYVLTHSVPVKSTPLPTNTPTVDSAACCKKENVSIACQPVCKSKTITYQSSCDGQASKIFDCLSDYRDHRECCKRDGAFPGDCLFMCNVTKTSVIQSSRSSHCLTGSRYNTIRDCYLEGHKLLPGPPGFILVHVYTSRSATISWSVPTVRPIKVIGYKVLLELTNGTIAKEQNILGTLHGASINGLTPNTEYKVTVVTVGEKNFFSMPSTPVTLRTLPELPTNWTSTAWKHFSFANITECCRHLNVPENCLPLCEMDPSSGAVNDSNLPSRLAPTCSHHIGSMVKCMADGRNHEPCCQGRLVTSACVPMCSGRMDPQQVANPACYSSLNDVRSCFLEGYVNLPKPPKVVKVEPRSQTSIIIQLDISHQANVTYLLLSKTKEGPIWNGKHLKTTDEDQTLTGFKSSTWYAIHVIAINNYGTSLPTPQYSVKTFANGPFELWIYALPSATVKQGTNNVSLTCLNNLNVPLSQTTIIWFLNGSPLDSSLYVSNTVILKSVGRAHAGQYTCQVHYEGKVYARSLFFRVQYVLQGSTQKNLIVRKLYTAVTMRCVFEGFPDSIEWTGPDGKVLTQGHFLISSGEEQLHSYGKLTIYKIYPEQYGTYICTGKNSFSEKKISILLTNSTDAIEPTALPPSQVDAPACCKTYGVNPRCMDACKFQIDPSFFNINTMPPECHVEFLKIFHCLSDGRNHTKCCSMKNVDSFCLPMCSGKLPPSNSARILNCLTRSATDITTCMEKGHEEIPSQPLGLRLVSANTASLTVAWNLPERKASTTTEYDVTLQNLKMKTKSVVELKVTNYKETQKTITGLNKSTTYTVTVVARNWFGQSLPSTASRMSTWGPPEQPLHVYAKLITNVDVRITWMKPPYSDVPVDNWTIIWMEVSKSSKKHITNVTLKQELTLRCLRPATSYTFSVVAENKLGKSKQSAEARVLTGAKDIAACKAMRKTIISLHIDHGPTIAAAIILTLLVLVLIAVIFYMVLQHWRQNGLPPSLRRYPSLYDFLRNLTTPNRSAHRVPANEFDNPISFDARGDYSVSHDTNAVSFSGQAPRDAPSAEYET